MIEALTYEDMAEDYPLVFQNGRPRCGIDVGQGWETLLRELLQAMEDLLPSKHDFKVVQVKEKFGGLRFYIFSQTLPEDPLKKICKLIDFTEGLSLVTCEACGARGEPNTKDSRFSWVKTLCARHREEGVTG